MESREMIKEILGELVSEEAIDSAIREIVTERFNYTINTAIDEVAHRYVREKGESYIKEKVDEVLEKPVKRDDGWGQPEYYDSFEHFVKSIIAEQIQINYRFTQAIDRMVKDRLSEVIRKVSKEISEKMVDEALAEIAKE